MSSDSSQAFGSSLKGKRNTQNYPELSVAILAGGRATRLGGVNKGLLVFDGRYLIEEVIERVRGISDDIFIVTDRQRVDTKCFGALDDYEDIRLVEDIVEGIGPLGGVYTALVSSIYKYVFVCAVDMPFIDSDVIGRMRAYLNNNIRAGVCNVDTPCGAIVPKWIEKKSGKEMIEPLFAVYSKDLSAEVEAYISSKPRFFSSGKENEIDRRYSLHGFIRRMNGCHFISVTENEKKAFVNINTLDEYTKYSGNFGIEKMADTSKK